jgi:Flp pilus assembly protein TadD
MARFEKSSTKRTSTNAAVAPRKRASQGSSYEDTMFFPRLRRHAKWMFVFLALVFGLGFVVFGVGAGGVGVGDVFRGSGSGEAQSVSDARKATEERPKDVSAWQDLSLALQTEGETSEAITALETAAGLAPKDAGIQRELAGLYLVLAGEKQRDAQTAQLRAAFAGATQNLPGLLVAPTQQPVLSDPIGRAVNALAAEKTTSALQEAGQAAASAVDAYRTVAALEPNDPNVQIELAQTAEQAGDAATAITAYEAFLRLAPDDPNASIVEQQLKQLRQSSGAASG